MTNHPLTKFPTTHWSLVARAATESGPRRREVLQDLLRRYIRPLTVYLTRARGLPAADADDLVQGFTVSQVLEGELLATADPARGRFRTFLLHALNHYVAAAARDARRVKRGGGAVASLENGLDVSDSGPGPEAVFDIEWARAVLGETIERLRQECAHGEFRRPRYSWLRYACTDGNFARSAVRTRAG